MVALAGQSWEWETKGKTSSPSLFVLLNHCHCEYGLLTLIIQILTWHGGIRLCSQHFGDRGQADLGKFEASLVYIVPGHQELHREAVVSKIANKKFRVSIQGPVKKFSPKASQKLALPSGLPWCSTAPDFTAAVLGKALRALPDCPA